MNSIEYYTGNSAGRGVSRPTGRALSQIEANTQIALAAVAAQADVQAAQIDAMTATTQRGLHGTAYITNIEMALAEATPAAMVRLKLIGDTGAMALQHITLDTAYKLRRL